MKEVGLAWLLPPRACQGHQGLVFLSCTAGGWVSLSISRPPHSCLTCPSLGGLATRRP